MSELNDERSGLQEAAKSASIDEILTLRAKNAELRAKFDSMVRLNDANLKCYDNCAKERRALKDAGYIYLASPYSHHAAYIRQRRFEEVCWIAGKLMIDGLLVFSPIAHTHPIAELCDLPKGWDYWQKYDEAMILGSCKVIVACMDGWRESKGVTAEIEIALQRGIPVEYLVSSDAHVTIKTPPEEVEPSRSGYTSIAKLDDNSSVTFSVNMQK